MKDHRLPLALLYRSVRVLPIGVSPPIFGSTSQKKNTFNGNLGTCSRKFMILGKNSHRLCKRQMNLLLIRRSPSITKWLRSVFYSCFCLLEDPLPSRNSMVAAYTGWEDSRNDLVKAVTFGDGTPLPSHVIHDCRLSPVEATSRV